MMTSDEVKSLRKRLGLTQAAFAAALGVDQGSVSNWETGKTSPSGPAVILMQNLNFGPAKSGAAA